MELFSGRTRKPFLRHIANRHHQRHAVKVTKTRRHAVCRNVTTCHNMSHVNMTFFRSILPGLIFQPLRSSTCDMTSNPSQPWHSPPPRTQPPHSCSTGTWSATVIVLLVLDNVGTAKTTATTTKKWGELQMGARDWPLYICKDKYMYNIYIYTQDKPFEIIFNVSNPRWPYTVSDYTPGCQLTLIRFLSRFRKKVKPLGVENSSLGGSWMRIWWLCFPQYKGIELRKKTLTVVEK